YSKLQIGLYPLGVMLHKRPGMSFPRQQERDWLRGWALVGALRFCAAFKSDDHHSRLAAGLRVARLMTSGGYEQDLISELPSFDGSLYETIDAVRSLGRILSLRGEHWQTQIDQLVLLLRDGQG